MDMDMNEKYLGLPEESFGDFITAADEAVESMNAAISHGREFISDENGRGLIFWLSAAKRKEYQSGSITREEALKLALRRMEKKNCRLAFSLLERIAAASEEDDVFSILIDVEWRKNRTYGNLDPHVKVQFVGTHGIVDFGTGTASGGNYDKLSSAVAAAFDGEPLVDRLFLNGKAVGAVNRNITYSDPIPSLRRGVGINAQIEALEELGFVLIDKSWSDDGSYDYFYLTKKE